MSELSGQEARTKSGAYNNNNNNNNNNSKEQSANFNYKHVKSSNSSENDSSVGSGGGGGAAHGGAGGSGSFSGLLDYNKNKSKSVGQRQTLTGKSPSSGQAPASHLSASSLASSTKGNKLLNEPADEHDNKTSSKANKDQIKTPTTTTTTITGSQQRISSIDILNENKQRQLQFKQQESFKQHLEQRLIQQQQQGEQGQEDDLGVITYQVNTDAPNYMAMAAKGGDSAGGGVGLQAKRSLSAASGGIAVNPFEEAERAADLKAARPTRSATDPADKSATVSGKKGFLSALMDEASFDPDATGKLDESNEELNSVSATRKTQSLGGGGGQGDTRYSKLAGASSSYNYDDDPSKRPFYQRDLATLLQDCRSSRKLIIIIVAVALLLDNMLLTSVVPIIPAHLYKLRIERQHRNQLESNKSLFMPTAINRADSNNNQLDLSEADMLEAELDRRINQSLTGLKGRYSGSVFHPRVRVDQAALANDFRPGALDRTDREQEQLTGNGAARSRGRAGRNENDDVNDRNDDDDDDDGDDDDAVASADDDDDKGKNGGSRKVAAQRKNGANRKQLPTRKLDKYKPATDDDEYEDDDDDGDGNENENENGAKKQDGRPRQSSSYVNKVERTNAKPAMAIQSFARKYKPQSSGASELDGDDEDLLDANRWQRLRSSLVSMARLNGSDTDALGGMCLNYVLSGDLNSMSPNNNDQLDMDPSNRNRVTMMREKTEVRDRSALLKSSNNPQMRGATAKQSGGGRDDEEKAAATSNSRRSTRASGASNRPRAPRLMVRPTNRRPPPQPVTEGTTPATVIVGKDKDEPIIISHQDIVDESFEVGVMFASKPIVQAFANPFIGTLTNKVGFTIPMFTGFVIMFLSTLVFAFGSSYSTLFIARAIQGVGSACTSVAGMSMLADRFPDDAERGNAMAIALGGLALGVVIGPPFGGFMYEFVGKSSPFIVLSILALLDGLLQLLVLQPRVTENQEEGASLMTLIKDPYILVAAGAITFANTGIAILEPALPLWMMDTMQAKNWEQGVAFLPAALSYMFGTNLFGNIGHKIGRWRATMIGLVIIGCSLLLIPFATRVEHLIIPNGAIGFAMGMVDSTMMPMLGYLVDIRHTSVYGSVYAIGDVAFCASFAFGPALSGTLVELIGFEGLIITTALICFAFAPLLFLLRDPPARQVDEAQLQEQSSLRYVNYSHLDSPDEEAQLTGFTKSNPKTYVR